MDRALFAARLRDLREQAGISQAKAAKAAGLHAQTWSAYERGRIHPQAMRVGTLARALGVPAGALYDPRVIADVVVTPETLERLAREGEAATADVAQRLAQALAPVLAAAAQRHAQARAPRAGMEAGPPPTLASRRRRAARQAERAAAELAALEREERERRDRAV